MSDQVGVADVAEISSVLRLYDRVGYGGGVAEGDHVLVVRSMDEIVAAVRLCDESNTLVLRGMYVSEERRGQRVGTRLLEFAALEIGSVECWCIPYEHLVDFYSQIGFAEDTTDNVPGFLKERRVSYELQGSHVTIMRRAAAL